MTTADNIAKIPLTQGKFAIVDAEDLKRCLQYKWCAYSPIKRRHTWYAHHAAKRLDGGKTTMALHRFLLGNPKGVDIDHVNGDGLDNRKSNLRIATRSQNIANQRRRHVGTSQYKGVGWQKNSKKWQAFITVNRKMVYLGLFDSEKGAAHAYNDAAVEKFGEFAQVNNL